MKVFNKRLSPRMGYIVVSSLATGMTHLMGPYLTLWLRSVGMTFVQIGFLQSVSSFVTFLTDFPTGGLSDKYGRRLNYAIGIFIFAFSLLIIAMSRSFLWITFAFALAGFGSALMSGTMIPWLYDALDGDRGAVQRTLGTMKAINGIIGAFAGFFAGFLSRYALNLPIVTAAVCGMLAAFVAIALLEENYGHGKEESYLRILKDGIGHIARMRALHYLILSSLLLTFAARSFFMFWMVLARQVGLSDSGVGYVYPLLILSTSVGGVISIRLSETVDPRRLLILSTLSIGPVIVLMGIVGNLFVLLALLVTFEVLISVRGPVMVTFKNELIPSEIRSTVNSALSTIGNAFTMLVNLIVGILADKVGLNGAYTISGFLAIFSVVFLVLAVRNS